MEVSALSPPVIETTGKGTKEARASREGEKAQRQQLEKERKNSSQFKLVIIVMPQCRKSH